MYKYCMVLDDKAVTEAIKAQLSEILLRPVDCEAVITNDYLCVRLPDRLPNEDLQKVCNQIECPSEDHMKANASLEDDSVPDIGEELVFDLLIKRFGFTTIANKGLLNGQVVFIL